MGFVGVLRAKCAGEQNLPMHVSGPRFAKGARKRKQHRTPRERYEHVALAHEIAAGIDDKRLRREQRLDLLQQKWTLHAARDQSRRWQVEDVQRLCDFRGERRNACPARGFLGVPEGRACCPGADTPHGNTGDRELVYGAQRRCKTRDVALREDVLGFFDAADQEQTPHLEVVRVGGVRLVAMLFESCRCRGE